MTDDTTNSDTPQDNVRDFEAGINTFKERAEAIKDVYRRVLDEAQDDSSDVHRVTDEEQLTDTLRVIGPSLQAKDAANDLTTIYDAALHKPTGALIISNKGATLYAKTPRTQTSYIARHIGLYVLHPRIGIEFLNVGVTGDIYDDPIVVRSESACTPSFLFGSQRCNCAHQWDSAQELAAQFNPVTPPSEVSGDEFEAWVQRQAWYDDGKHGFKNPGLGFVLIHADTQNGMGSGYTEDEFVFDMHQRASIRHRGEYTAEQVHNTTMAGGFKAIGLQPDPRRGGNNAGYEATKIALDYLDVSNDVVFLTNNDRKLDGLKDYNVTRLKSLGEINAAGAREARQRGTEFGHHDINASPVTFNDEIDRLTRQIKELST